MAGQSHLNAASASQGLKKYLATCGGSGLESVRDKAAEYMALPKAERMRLYISNFGSRATWGNSDSPKEEVSNMEDALKALGLNATQIAAIAALGTVEDGDEDVAPASPIASCSFRKGTRFAFTSRKGNRVEHTSKGVKEGFVNTDSGRTFRLTSLQGVLAEQVELV